MNEIQIIQFTQDQARTITGISSETLRHWRKNIPYLAEKSGKAARFSFSDLICLASTAKAIEAFGASISNIGPVIDSLFRMLAESRPAMLQNQAVVIREKNASICYLGQIAKLDFSTPVMVIPLTQLTESMRQCLLPELSGEQQLEIPFTPQSVRG
jgi:DNA-binding transcriptional MerR regulator